MILRSEFMPVTSYMNPSMFNIQRTAKKLQNSLQGHSTRNSISTINDNSISHPE